DLDRMMTVIINDHRAIDLADLCETALHATEAGEAGLDRLVADAELERDADRRQRILDIMAARHRQLDTGKHAGSALAAADRHVEAVATGERNDIVAPDVRLGGEAVSDDAPVAHPGDDRLHFRMIDAQQRGAIERHILDELDERILHLVEAAIMIEMLGIDIG